MKRTHLARRSLWTVGTVTLFSAAISAQVTQRVNVKTGGGQANGGTVSFSMAISPDGRYVAFVDNSTDLVPGDTNGTWDVFVRDRIAGTTERVSVATGGVEANGPSYFPSISADGRFVAFESMATNLVPGDTNGLDDIFVRDRVAGTTERVSLTTNGAQVSHLCDRPSISGDGRYVAFDSAGGGLVPGDTNERADVFVRDRLLGTTERVSLDSNGVQGDDNSLNAAITPDGRFVAFESYANNLVPGDTNGWRDIFVHDRQTGTTVRVNVDSSGVQSDLDSDFPSISADGRYVAFESFADDLVAGDTDGGSDIFVHDLLTGVTERVSVTSSGAQANDVSWWPSISADGRCVAFKSHASDLVAHDTNQFFDVFVRDRIAGTTERVSVATSGIQGNGDSGYNGLAIAGGGRFVAFSSHAGDLDPNDTNFFTDIFVHDRESTSFTSLCGPGNNGVIACPCANAPAGPGRGCDNSAGTGGATIAASGIAYLSLDSVVFSTSGEKPTATSIVLQGSASPPAGMVYGQGVRCVGGLLKRLFVKTAVSGSITAPDFGAGDPTVSSRSSAKGDVIQPGQSRFYLVYYRDPTVLGGCPASSTFNATQTGRVSWQL